MDWINVSVQEQGQELNSLDKSGMECEGEGGERGKKKRNAGRMIG